MRKTLVIGGTRNLGPDLVAALLERGDQVAVLNRGLSPVSLPPGVERLHADRSDETQLRTTLAARSYDLVIDTTLYTGRDAALAVRILAGRAGRYVMWSTGQVYLVRDGISPPFRESDYDGALIPEPSLSRRSDHENWLYGVGKREAEDALREEGDRHGLRVAVLRMPMIHSVRDHYARIPNYVHRLLDGGPILVPDEPAAGIRHVFGADVIAATLAAAGEVADGAYNIGQDETVSLDEALGMMASSCGATLRLRRLPRATLEALDLLPACSPFSSGWMSALDNRASRDVLGVRYTPMREYVPLLVLAACARSAAQVPGYEQRPRELAL